MIIRVQTNIGQWRINISEESTGQDLLNEITNTRPNILFQKSLSLDRSYQQPLDVHASLKAQKLSHGSMLYCIVDESTAVSTAAAAETTTETSTNNVHGDTATPSGVMEYALAMVVIKLSIILLISLFPPMTIPNGPP